jgi:hypothetical protein
MLLGSTMNSQGAYSQLAPFTKYNWNGQGTKGEIGWAFSMHGEDVYVYRILVGMPETKDQLGWPRCICRCQNNKKKCILQKQDAMV